MGPEWRPDVSTQNVVQEFAKRLIAELPNLLDINEIIGGCELIGDDPYGVGVGVVPRWVRVSIYEYHQDVWYSGNIGLTVGDYYTVLHTRTGDRYEILGPAGTGGASGGSWVWGTSTFIGDIILDDGVGDSPMVRWVGGSNDDEFQLWLEDDAIAGRSDLILKFPAADVNTRVFFRDSGDVDVLSFDADGNIYMLDDAFIGIPGDVRIEFDSSDGDILLHLGDDAGSDQVQILDSGPAVVAYIDSNGNADLLGHLAVGANAAVHAGRIINVVENTITNNITTYGAYIDATRTGGATNQHDRLGGIYAQAVMNANGVQIGHMYGLYANAVLTDGLIGDGATRHLYGGNLAVSMSAGTVSGDVYGMNFTTNLLGGTVDGGVYGSYTLVLTNAAMAAIGGDVYGAWVYVDSDEDPTGSVYVLHLTDRTNVDYSLYQDGTAPSYLSGLVAIGGTVVALAQVHVDQSSATGAIPVALFDQGDVSEQHILCSMGGADIDFPAVIELDVTGTPSLWWDESEDAWVFTNGLAIGDVVGGNYAAFAGDGDLSFTGTARIEWAKITANAVILTAGTTPAGVVADLQTAHDGNFYHIDEVAGAPGIDLIVDFISVTAFNWVNVLCIYAGSATHACAIQLYNWNTTAWDTFDATQTGAGDVTTASGYILDNNDFFIPSDANYIGTGGDAGKVRTRFYHTMMGNASHDLDIDVCALYQ